MEKENLENRNRELDEKVQNEFIDKLFEDIKFLAGKANRKDYIPTLYELKTMEQIEHFVKDINKNFRTL